MKTPHIAVIIPYRAADAYRKRNLETVTRHYHDSFGPEIKVIVVEQATEPTLTTSNRYTAVTVSDDGAFSKALLCNTGAKHTTADIVCFADNDILVPEESLQEAASVLRRTEMPACVQPFSILFDLDAAQTEQLLAHPEESIQLTHEQHARDGVDIAGGIVLMNRKAFDTVGGWNAAYRGWGVEDNALSYLLRKHTRVTRLPATGIHLYHPAVDLTTQQTNRTYYSHNLELFRKLLAKDNIDLQEYFVVNDLL